MVLELVLSYIPGVEASETAKYEGVAKTEVKPNAPPNRPDHDVQVEQFLRKQYHSTAGQGMPDPSRGD